MIMSILRIKLLLKIRFNRFLISISNNTDVPVRSNTTIPQRLVFKNKLIEYNWVHIFVCNNAARDKLGWTLGKPDETLTGCWGESADRTSVTSDQKQQAPVKRIFFLLCRRLKIRRRVKQNNNNKLRFYDYGIRIKFNIRSLPPPTAGSYRLHCARSFVMTSALT